MSFDPNEEFIVIFNKIDALVPKNIANYKSYKRKMEKLSYDASFRAPEAFQIIYSELLRILNAYCTYQNEFDNDPNGWPHKIQKIIDEDMNNAIKQINGIYYND